MIKIATPVSHLFKNESEAREIIEAGDCLEFRENYQKLGFSEVEIAHFNSNINCKWKQESRDYLRRQIDKYPFRFITFHMESNYEAPKIKNNRFLPSGKKLGRSEMLENVASNVGWLLSIGVNKDDIGVENNNYFPTGAYDTVTDCGFISEVISQNGIRFLLDIPHAKITSYNMGIEYGKYLSSLPMSRVKQLHISSHSISSDGEARDSHNPPFKGLYEETKKLISDYPVEYLTLEYYRNSEKLIEELANLRRIRDDYVFNSSKSL